MKSYEFGEKVWIPGRERVQVQVLGRKEEDLVSSLEWERETSGFQPALE
jgi:hypothetical protein